MENVEKIKSPENWVWITMLGVEKIQNYRLDENKIALSIVGDKIEVNILPEGLKGEEKRFSNIKKVVVTLYFETPRIKHRVEMDIGAEGAIVYNGRIKKVRTGMGDELFIEGEIV